MLSLFVIKRYQINSDKKASKQQVLLIRIRTKNVKWFIEDFMLKEFQDAAANHWKKFINMFKPQCTNNLL